MLAFFGDTHMETKLSPMDYLKSLDNFLQVIKDHEEPCHGIFSCGDLFNQRMSVQWAKFAAVFLLNLTQNRCSKDGQHVPVHFIHGTWTHDCDQYKIYLPLLVKITPCVFHDRIAHAPIRGKDGKELQVLYLPQEYSNDPDYYNGSLIGPRRWFNEKNKADIIVGHGPISSATKAPCPVGRNEILHSAEYLGKISNICVFGHYHGLTDFGNNVWYCGPWLRWRYGEDEPRKFFLCNDNYEVELYDNPIAKEYKTIEIDDPETLRGIISNEITTPHRFKITATDTNIGMFHGIINANKKNENLKWVLTSADAPDFTPPIPEITTSEVVTEDPVESLIDYVQARYGIDASKEIRDFDEKLKLKENSNESEDM
jgi:hypothetical protein